MESTPTNAGEASDAKHGSERRSSARAATRRPTFFGPLSGDALCQGTVIDVSADGMQIRTHAPLPAGAEIEVEVHEQSGNGERPPIYARGTVRWTKRLPDGASAMGIRLRAGRPVAAARREPSLDGALLRPKHRPPGLDFAERPPQAGAPVQFRAAPAANNDKKRRRWPLLLLFLLLCAVAALLWSLYQEMKRPAATRTTAPDTTEEAASPRPAAEEEDGTANPPADDGWGPMDTAYERLLAGMPGTAGVLFRDMADDPKRNPAERFAAIVGEAEAQLAGDDRQKAVATLAGALKETEGVAEPWRAVAREMRSSILRGEGVGAPVLFARVLEYADKGGRAERNTPPPPRSEGLPPPGQAAAPGVRIEVNTSRYLLTVFEGDRTLGIFPVGLGRNNTTPHGHFEVVNKILEPDWYDRGRVVKAGSLKNPLGGRWVGFGEEGRRTPYGIHGTNEPGSIGLSLSRGCVRMRPDDARKVFEWVGIGTPVRITP